MRTEKYIIAKGNPTALVSNYHESEILGISKKLLAHVEQVGFVSRKGIPLLRMMGGEMCINASIAFAYTLNTNGLFYLNSRETPILYKNKKTYTEISLNIPYQKKKNLLLLGGIGFIFYSKKIKKIFTKKELISLCQKYKLPAFGGITYENNQIFPVIYVKKTNSLITETSCGSGSIAFSIYKQTPLVIQPTGKKITVSKNKNKFSIRAKVEKI